LGEQAPSPLAARWARTRAKAHILGRGEDFGVKKSDAYRTVFSSVYNFAPLQRDFHKGPRRDHPLMRRLFLEIAKEKVDEAVRRGDYQLTLIDTDFLELAEKWLAAHPS
jgi:hypothetical protein